MNANKSKNMPEYDEDLEVVHSRINSNKEHLTEV